MPRMPATARRLISLHLLRTFTSLLMVADANTAAFYGTVMRLPMPMTLILLSFGRRASISRAARASACQGAPIDVPSRRPYTAMCLIIYYSRLSLLYDGTVERR